MHKHRVCSGKISCRLKTLLPTEERGAAAYSKGGEAQVHCAVHTRLENRHRCLRVRDETKLEESNPDSRAQW